MCTTLSGQTEEDRFAEEFAAAAFLLTGQEVVYDPAYYDIDYPNGDIPAGRGVCTDVLIRAYRTMGIDLQREVHEDMADHFYLYPEIWGLKKPDSNIDHRRVPNIATYLRRQDKDVPVTKNSSDYLPGDIVVWKLSNGRPHIGIFSNIRVSKTNRYNIVHNIGAGAKLEDALFAFEITAHFRYF